MRHVHVGRFVIFVERLRSLSCLVYSLYLLHSLFNNIALQWMISHFQAKHAIRCSAPVSCPHHLTYGRWVSISMPLPAKPVDFIRQSPCLCPPISMLLKGGFWIFVNVLDFRQLCVKCQMPNLPSLACGMRSILKLNLPFWYIYRNIGVIHQKWLPLGVKTWKKQNENTLTNQLFYRILSWMRLLAETLENNFKSQ